MLQGLNQVSEAPVGRAIEPKRELAVPVALNRQRGQLERLFKGWQTLSLRLNVVTRIEPSVAGQSAVEPPTPQSLTEEVERNTQIIQLLASDIEDRLNRLEI